MILAVIKTPHFSVGGDHNFLLDPFTTISEKTEQVLQRWGAQGSSDEEEWGSGKGTSYRRVLKVCGGSRKIKEVVVGEGRAPQRGVVNRGRWLWEGRGRL